MKVRIGLAFASVTATTLGFVVGFSSGHAVQPETDPCTVASASGPMLAEWVREASNDGASGDELIAYCRTLL